MHFSGEFTTPLAGIEDPVACGLHLAGAVFFAWQARNLVRRAGVARRRAAALAIFAGSGVLVLGISAFYHGLAVDHPWKATLQRADHAAIFLLIAATLTPYHAIGFHGRGRWWMVGCTWGIALAALVLKIVFWSDVGAGLGLGMYLGLAAIGLGAVLVLPRRLPWVALLTMALGGLVYVAGALADHLDVGRLVPGWFGPHEIFHVAVLSALLLHWRFFHAWSIPGRVPPRDAVRPRGAPLPSPSASF
jgi:hemolysin III